MMKEYIKLFKNSENIFISHFSKSNNNKGNMIGRFAFFSKFNMLEYHFGKIFIQLVLQFYDSGTCC